MSVSPFRETGASESTRRTSVSSLNTGSVIFIATTTSATGAAYEFYAFPESRISLLPPPSASRKAYLKLRIPVNTVQNTSIGMRDFYVYFCLSSYLFGDIEKTITENLSR